MSSRRLIELCPRLPSRVSRLEVCQLYPLEWLFHFRLLTLTPPETLTHKAQQTMGVKSKEAQGNANEVAGKAKDKAHELGGLGGKAKGSAEEL